MVRRIAPTVFLLLPLCAYAQGKLEAVREAVDRPRSSDSTTSDSNTSNTTTADESSNPLSIVPFLVGAGSALNDFDFPWHKRGGELPSWCSIHAAAEVGSDFD